MRFLLFDRIVAECAGLGALNLRLKRDVVLLVLLRLFKSGSSIVNIIISPLLNQIYGLNHFAYRDNMRIFPPC